MCGFSILYPFVWKYSRYKIKINSFKTSMFMHFYQKVAIGQLNIKIAVWHKI